MFNPNLTTTEPQERPQPRTDAERAACREAHAHLKAILSLPLGPAMSPVVLELITPALRALSPYASTVSQALTGVPPIPLDDEPPAPTTCPDCGGPERYDSRYIGGRGWVNGRTCTHCGAFRQRESEVGR